MGCLEMDEIYEVLEEEKPNQQEQIKIKANVLEEYSPTDFTPKQKVELIEQLVKEWHEKQMITKSIRYVIEDELTEKLGGTKTELYQLFEKFIDAYADEMDVLLEEMYLLGAKDREKMLK